MRDSVRYSPGTRSYRAAIAEVERPRLEWNVVRIGARRSIEGDVEGDGPDAAGETDKWATGSLFAVTTIPTVVVPVAPSSSVTVSVAVRVPADVYEWVIAEPGTPKPLAGALPSPNAVHDWIEPSVSELCEPSNVTTSVVGPLSGLAASVAVGGRFVVKMWSVASQLVPKLFVVQSV